MDDPAPNVTDDVAPTIATVLAPGTVVAGRYVLEARLGAGGGGTVWRCTDRQLGMIVALKIVAADGDLERWRREVAMARRIAHRNVCRVHDLGETGQLRYVTMELVEGRSLRDSIGREEPITARDRFEQLVRGVAAIHEAGVVHRDLKPENVVVGDDGRVVVVDFGLAREPRQITASDERATVNLRANPSPNVTEAGVAVGTPRYMSPEQALGETVDTRTDVWALGLVGHELLAGALPQASPEGRVIDPRVEQAWPGVAAILERCLAMTPADRFADARELASALASLAIATSTSTSTSSRAPTRPDVRPRRLRRIGVAIGLLAVIGGGAGAIAIVATSSNRGAPRTPAAGSSAIVRPVEARAQAADAAGSVTSDATVAIAVTSTPVVLERVTPEANRWPDEVPISVALDRDGARYAYTTLEGKIFVGSLADATSVDKWVAPRYHRTTSDYQTAHATLRAVGWFSDGSLAVNAVTKEATSSLYRVYADGRSTLLHHQDARFTAAIANDDRIAIGKPGEAVWQLARDAAAAPIQLVALEPGERAAALAWSPDGQRLAIMRTSASSASSAAARVQIFEGGTVRDVWSGNTQAELAPLLVWLEDGRLCFTDQVAATRTTRLLAVRADGAIEERTRWVDETIAGGSAAAGVVLVLHGRWAASVLVGERDAMDLAPAIGNVASSHLAGWLADGRLVFAAGEPSALQIVRAVPGKTYEPWPGAKPGVDVPDSVVETSVIAHRRDDGAPPERGVIVERIDDSGARVELARQAIDSPVVTPIRCAGDRAAPCVLQVVRDAQASFVEIDPMTGKRLDVIHMRGYRAGTQLDFAISFDGNLMAISDGGRAVTIVDRATHTTPQHATTADTEVRAPSFDRELHLWLAVENHRGRLFGIGAFEKRRGTTVEYGILSSRGAPHRDLARVVSRIAPSLDGARVAIAGRELRVRVARMRW